MSQTQYSAALLHHRAGELAQAESLYQLLLKANPKHADALHMLGVVYYQTDRAEQAVNVISQALAINPKNTDYLNHYALSLRAANQPEAAIRSFQQAVLLQPKDLDIQFNLANTLLTLNRYEEAAGYYRRILRVMPKNDDTREALCHCLTSLGNQAHIIGHFIQAEACFEEALQFNKQDAAIYYNLGNAQRELGKPAEAAKQYAQAIRLAPDDADIYNNLGNVQRELGQLDLAIASYRKALALNPQLYHAKVHLVHQKQHICDWNGLTDDITEIRNWVNTLPQAQISPFAFLAMPGTTAAEQKLCADNWVKNRYASLMELGRQSGFSAQKKPAGKKIRIGYMSADFRLHPLAFLISELLELHDRSQFEIIGFSYGADDKTVARKRIQKAFDTFYDISRLPDTDAAKKIHDCGIDILVDLTGFTQNSRCGIIALRPANVSVSWLGFPGTMGSFIGGNLNNKPLFDYLLTDSFITPPEAACNYAEQLALLPHSYQPNDRKRPVAKTPSRAEYRLPDNAFVFCCFNQTFKITEDLFNCWMRLLKATPNSVLWLLDCNRWAKQNLTEQAALHGISSERLIFAPRVSIADHLARHAHADLFLDTLPYNAHTTCSDALWMGLPVLTCVGDTFASRVAGSLLKAAGLHELITYTLADYENKALSLTKTPQALNTIKQKLMSEKMTSALFDTAKFSRSLELIYKDIQTNHLNQNPNV
jgi:predicted O-linked N-acetylglucosamine transferase (SPINDLY family)